MDYTRAKRRLIAALKHDINDERVLAAIARVHREAFVPPDLADRVYDNTPLPIGAGQTISQPLMVGIMLQALDVQPTDEVLDVGVGSGYQAALLSELAASVLSTERIPALADRARRALQLEGCANVQVVEAGPAPGVPGQEFDGIVVGASAPSVPPSLLQQLRLGGRLVIPVGTPFDQYVAKVTRTASGNQVRWLGPCRFVPLLGDEGWPQDPPEFPMEERA